MLDPADVLFIDEVKKCERKDYKKCCQLQQQPSRTLQYYSVNGRDYAEYTEPINCNNGGNYSVRYYTKIGDYESDIAEVYIKTSLNTYIPDGLMLALLLIFSITLFVVVVPIVSRKFFKHN